MILEKLDQSSKLIDEQVKQIDLFVEENLVHQLELQIIGSRTTRMKYQHYFDLVLSECSRKLVIRNSADFKLIEPNFQNLTLAIDAPETDEKRMTFWKELSTELARLDTVHVLKINLNKYIHLLQSLTSALDTYHAAPPHLTVAIDRCALKENLRELTQSF